jgi:hypothetical protein
MDSMMRKPISVPKSEPPQHDQPGHSEEHSRIPKFSMHQQSKKVSEILLLGLTKLERLEMMQNVFGRLFRTLDGSSCIHVSEESSETCFLKNLRILSMREKRFVSVPFLFSVHFFIFSSVPFLLLIYVMMSKQ